MTATAQRLTNLFARTSTPALIAALLALDTDTSETITAENRWARAKTIEELERRYPVAADAVEAAFDAADARIEAGEDIEVDYVAVLVAAIPGDER